MEMDKNWVIWKKKTEVKKDLKNSADEKNQEWKNSETRAD